MTNNYCESVQDKMQQLSADIYQAFLDYTLDPELHGFKGVWEVRHYLDTYDLRLFQIDMALEVARELFICG